MTTRGGASRLLWALTLAVLLAAGSASAAAGSTAGRVFLQTVPALPGVHLLVDGRTVTTGPDGSAAVAVADLNGVASRVRLAGRRPGRPSPRWRWPGSSPARTRCRTRAT